MAKRFAGLALALAELEGGEGLECPSASCFDAHFHGLFLVEEPEDLDEVGDVEDQTRRSERHKRRHAESELAKKDGSKVFASTDNLAVTADRL